MKKKLTAFLSFCFIFLLPLSLQGCGCASSSNAANLSFSADDVKYVELFAGPVPTATEKKIITGEKDIQNIIALFDELTTTRRVRDSDLLSGGIANIFRFQLVNGESQVVYASLNQIFNANGHFIVNNDELGSYAFWLSLPYETVKVSEDDLPIIE